MNGPVMQIIIAVISALIIAWATNKWFTDTGTGREVQAAIQGKRTAASATLVR